MRKPKIDLLETNQADTTLLKMTSEDGKIILACVMPTPIARWVKVSADCNFCGPEAWTDEFLKKHACPKDKALVGFKG